MDDQQVFKLRVHNVPYTGALDDFQTLFDEAMDDAVGRRRGCRFPVSRAHVVREADRLQRPAEDGVCLYAIDHSSGFSLQVQKCFAPKMGFKRVFV